MLPLLNVETKMPQGRLEEKRYNLEYNLEHSLEKEKIYRSQNFSCSLDFRERLFKENYSLSVSPESEEISRSSVICLYTAF